MDISVIIPVYGVEKYIKRSLTSLFNQTKTDGVEFILVNDCTKDRSMEIAREVALNYPDLNIIFIDKEVNGGLACARQTGMNAASGTYMIHIDSDDWCEPTMLKDLYECAVKSNADIVVCDFFINYPNKEIYINQSIPENKGLQCVRMLLEDKIRGHVWNKFIKRSLFVESKICWVPYINFWEDKLIVTKLFCCTDKIAYLPKSYLHYEQNPESMVNSMSDQSRSNLISAIECMDEFFKDRDLYETLKYSFAFTKLSAKSKLLSTAKSYSDQKGIVKMYSSCDSEVFNHPTLPKHYKIALYNAVKGRLFIANLIYYIIKLIKKITR